MTFLLGNFEFAQSNFLNYLNWTIWYVFSVSTFTCCNETQWVAKIKCLLLTRQQHDWYTALNISLFYKKGGKDRSGLRGKSNGWIRMENYFQVKNFYVRKPSLRIAGFVTSKYESSILTLKITWLQHTFDSDQTKTNLLSQLFWSKGKAISKYKDRLYFLVNFQIDFAQLYRARKKIIFRPGPPTTAPNYHAQEQIEFYTFAWIASLQAHHRLTVIALELNTASIFLCIEGRVNRTWGLLKEKFHFFQEETVWHKFSSIVSSRCNYSKILIPTLQKVTFKMQSGPQHKQNRPAFSKMYFTTFVFLQM